MSLSVDLHTRVGGFELDVAFDVPDGITALFGPSGAGKSLTLRCIAGLSRPLSGRVVVSDQVLFDSSARIDVPARKRHIGYVFQQYLLFPHLDVAGNVAFGLAGTGDEKAARVGQLLELLGLPGYEARRPGELSGGEQQRVALARALAPGPNLLLLDEPLSALDTRVRRRLRAELRRIHTITRVPMVLVTHSQAEMRELADWVVLYEGGRVLRSGSREDVLRDPGSPEAAELLEDVLA